ncbi:MAG: hypothetical protein AAFO81_15080 [Pseudomonadota bacterium]
MRAGHSTIAKLLLVCAAAASWPLSAAEIALVLPNSFRAYLLDAAGSHELVPEWTTQARIHLHAAMVDIVERDPQFKAASMPALSDEQRAVLEEHVALFEANAQAAIEMIRVAGVAHKKHERAYSLGSGLAFLAAAGIDKAVLVSGSQTWSTRGRVLSRVLPGALGRHIAPAGASGLLIGYIDTTSGDITWMHAMHPVRGGDVRDADGAVRVLDKLVAQYPDGLIYAQH